MPDQRYIAVMTLRDLHERRHPDNPKGHDVPGIVDSILRFGFGDLPMLCERTGRIAKGHGRLEACETIRDSADPNRLVGILEEGPEGDWLIPVVRGWSSVDDAELMAYMIADNRYTERGGWTDRTLAEQMQMLTNTAAGLTGVGFSQEQFDDLLARLAGPPTLEALAAQHGEPDPRDLWPVLRFSVSPDLRDAYVALRARWLPDEDGVAVDTEMFKRLLALASEEAAA
jgi:hypothetical protein